MNQYVYSGLDHFDDFRFFHFFMAPVVDKEGNIKHVGVFQCKARVVDEVWHDTRGDRSKYIPLFIGMLCFEIFQCILRTYLNNSSLHTPSF
jgi:hypothetical protein